MQNNSLILTTVVMSAQGDLRSHYRDKAEDSGFEAPPPSESDRESENTTTTDFSVNQAKESLLFKKIPSQSSSFVQNILYEDSCTGVTVIDLFIALKSVKENLEYLSKSNENMSDRMYLLNEETQNAWKEFVELLESMRMFSDKMNKDASNFNLKKLENKFSQIVPTNDTHLFDVNESKKETKWPCTECGRNINEIHPKEDQKSSCLDCLFSAFKERSLSQLSVSPETFLGSFLTSVLHWQKMRERERKAKSIKSSSSILEEGRSDGSLNIKESTVQMICDICEILNVAGVHERDELQHGIPLGSPPDSCAKNPVDIYDESDWSGGMSGVSKEKCLRVQANTLKGKNGERSKAGVESGGELTSEGDSEFEEALSCDMNHHHDVKAKPSITCMGDLSKAVVGKKSASTITPNNNIFSSWVGKLSDVIRSKIKQIKSKRKNKTNVKVFEKPFEKSETALKKHPGMLQFSITASTSAGVFDITVIQYKKHCYLAKSPANYKRNIQLAPGSDSSHFTQNFHSPLLKDSKDDFWSDESISNSEPESMETCSNFGDDDMIEFLEIYLENKDDADLEHKEHVLSPKSRKFDECRNIELKTGKTHFFEMHRRYAVYFIEEFIKKTKKTEVDQRPENENISYNASEEEIISLNSGEKQEKQIVMKGSSSDLVIYIQVKVEDDSEPNSSCVFLDFEKKSFKATPKENDPQTSSTFFEKAIRLRENQQKGESLYNIWRAHDTNQIPETEDMEMVTYEKPFVRIEKPEQKMNKYEERMKVKSVSFREDFSELFAEREIQDTFLEDKIIGRADVLSIREIKQLAQIWYQQIPKRRKLEILRLRRKPKLSRDIIDSINSSAGELRKALCFIREIEDDIVDAQFEDAISILPRLELELRNHLHTKIKGLEVKESKDRISVGNFLSSFDLDQQSIGGRSEESSEYRFNYLLKLLSNLEDAVKASEHASNKIELSHFDSTKIYELLHALTDKIRELEEIPNVAGLSQILNIASKLDHAIREYDNTVKKQPVDYLVPEERTEKKRKPKWKTAEEASVAQHLKNVRKKVFEMVEMEAVGMEDRIQRDFEKLDQLEMENDEAMMFLETLIRKIQKRMSEFQNLKSDLQQMYSSANTLYENYRKETFQEKEEKKETETVEKNMKKSLERTSEKISGSSSRKTSRRKIKNRVQERTANRVSELSTNRTLKKNLERSSDMISVKIPEKTPPPNPKKIEEIISKKHSESFPEQTSNDVSEKTLDRTSEESSRRNTENSTDGTSRIVPITKSTESISNKILEKISRKISKRGSENIQEKIPEKISTSPDSSEASSTVTVLGKISTKTSEKILEKIQEEEPQKNYIESPSTTAPELLLSPTNQESLEHISTAFINATKQVKTTHNTGKNESNDVLPPFHPFEKIQSMENLSKPNQLSSTIIELKVIGENSLYLSWTEPEGSMEGSITGYEIHVDGKLNQKVRNPQRVQAVLYSVNLSKKIQVQLYGVVENNVKVLLASMDLNCE